MSFGIEVNEKTIELTYAAEALRHSNGCLLLLDGKPFLIDEQTAVRLAWDLCVMFQKASVQGANEASTHV